MKLPRIRFGIASIFAVTALVAVGLSFRSLRLHYLVSRMSNSDIASVVETRFKLEGATQRIVDEYGLEARDKLKSLLLDPNRFASAHLALVKVTRTSQGGTYRNGPNQTGDFQISGLNYYRDPANQLHFRVDKKKHLRHHWIDFVGNHTGHFLIDEETDGIIWLDDQRRNNQAMQQSAGSWFSLPK